MERRKFFTIFAIVFTNILGAQLILPVFPLFAENEFGATEVQVALFTSAYFVAQFFGAPILGRLSDRYGRRPVLIISQLGTVLSFVMFIFSREMGAVFDGAGIALPFLKLTGGLIWLYLARILDGITGGNIITAQAYVSDISTARDRALALGRLGAAFGVGFMFGPLLGGELSRFGPLVPFIASALITTVTVILTVVILDESLTPERRAQALGKKEDKPKLGFSEVMGSPVIVALLGLAFVETLAFSAIPPTLTLYADRVLFPPGTPPETVSIGVGRMLALVGTVSAVTQGGLIKPLKRLIGETRIILMGQILQCIAFAFVPIAGSVLVLALIFVPFAFGRGATQPTERALMTKLGTDQTRGQLLGLYQSAVSIGFMSGPIWSGQVFQYISPQAVWWVGAVIFIPAIIMAVLVNSRYEREEDSGVRSQESGVGS